MIVEIEDRRAEARDQTFTWIGVAAGVIGIVLLMAVVPSVIRAIPLPVPFSMPIKVLLIAVAIAWLTTKGLLNVLPSTRRFPELIANRKSIALPSRLLAPKRATWIALGLFVASGVVITLATPVVKRWSAEEEQSHKAAISSRYGELLTCVESKEPAQCKSQLESLAASLDNRRADAAVRLVLAERLRCVEGACDSSDLDKHFDSITEAMQKSGQFVRGRSSQPVLKSTYNEPFGARLRERESAGARRFGP